MVHKLGNKHKNASYQTTRSVLGPSLSAQTTKCPIIRARVLDKTSHPGDWFLVKSQSIARTPQGVNIDGCIIEYNVQEAYLPKMSIWGQIVSEIVAQLCLQNSIQTHQNFFWVDPRKN